VRRPVLIALAAAALLAGCGGDDDERDRAIEAAATAYAQAESSGIDLAPGPCIAEQLPDLGDWVVDIAHDPRAPVDDDPANQCRRYRDGEASHFVELDPQGELLRAE
jgi:hypothetical protein